MLDWRDLKVGDYVFYTVDEFDGKFEEVKMVREVCDDHIIIGSDADEHIWIDDDFKHMISRINN